jgi:cytochrome c peroxidase
MKLTSRWTGTGGLLLLAMSGITLAVENPGPVSVDQKKAADFPAWSEAEIATLRSLWIGSLPPLPPDPSNAVADDPAAAALGQRMFFDPRFSANGEVACVTCHLPEKAFTDGLGRAQGMGTTRRGAPTLIGAAYNPWFFWDGRSDSQWSQALGPLENELEHGGSRTRYAHILYADPVYREQYEAVFDPLPDLSDHSRFPDEAGPVSDKAATDAWQAMSETDREAVTRIFVNMGKAIAAYERLILPAPASFDNYVDALLAGDDQVMQAALTPDAIAGLRVFIGKGMCINCHNGPLFTNYGFQNVGVPVAQGLTIDEGRYRGVQQVVQSEFNCLGNYSDAGEKDCAELRFAQMSRDEIVGAFKVPSLRNVADTAPYTHSGEYATLAQVLEHYNKIPVAPIGYTDLFPVTLSKDELKQLEAFLRSLSGPSAITAGLLQAPAQ